MGTTKQVEGRAHDRAEGTKLLSTGSKASEHRMQNWERRARSQRAESGVSKLLGGVGRVSEGSKEHAAQS